jgi:hypothetical protein
MMTFDELHALPVGGGFGVREEWHDGKLVMVPFREPFQVVYVPDDHIQRWMDTDGNRWRLAQFPDGRWCKVRS